MKVVSGGGTQQRGEPFRRQCRHLADGDHAGVVEFGGCHRPDSPEALDRQGMKKGDLLLGRDHQEAVGLGDCACHLGQELGPGDTDRDGEANLFSDLITQTYSDLGRRSGDAAKPADI
jgi:hypothetical protein